MTESLTHTLADYAASTDADDLPEEVVERAKLVILDEMASAYFGRQKTAGGLGARFSTEVGGPGESLILGTVTRVSAPYAALANGTAGHADEIDGAHVVGGHPGATIVHASVALAEAEHRPGAELINAVVLGYDIGTRLLGACGGIFETKRRFSIHGDFLYGVGSAMSSARLLQLDPAKHGHALALATFQANGLCALYDERRHISKALCNGQYAFAGVSAALMAKIGLEGVDDILGEQFGLLQAWGVEGAADRVVNGLGEDFAIMGANFKFSRAGYPIHAAVEAAMTLVEQHGVALDAVSTVEVGMPENSLRVVDNRDMHNICLQDMLTVALVSGGLDLKRSYFPEILQDAAYVGLRPLVTLDVDPELNAVQPNGRGARVTITTKSGDRHSALVAAPKGHSSRGGATWSGLAEKWGNALEGADVDRMITAVRNLDDLEDVRSLTEAFATPAP